MLSTQSCCRCTCLHVTTIRELVKTHLFARNSKLLHCNSKINPHKMSSIVYFGRIANAFGKFSNISFNCMQRRLGDDSIQPLQKHTKRVNYLKNGEKHQLLKNNRVSRVIFFVTGGFVLCACGVCNDATRGSLLLRSTTSFNTQIRETLMITSARGPCK